MPVLVVGTETNFSALRARLVGRGRLPAGAARRIEAELRAANPHVDLDALHPGAVLTVPDLPEVDVEGLALDDTTRGVVRSAGAELRAGLDGVVAAAGEHAAEDTAARKRVQRAFAHKDIRAAAGRDPELAATLESAQAAVEQEAAVSKQQLAALAGARTRWAAELDVLAELLG